MDDQNCCLSLQVSQDATVVEQNGNTEELDLQDYEFRKHPWGSVFEGLAYTKLMSTENQKLVQKLLSLALRKSSFMLIITILVECPQAPCSQCNITCNLVLLAGFA